MPATLDSFLHDLTDPATVPGAIFYAILFALIAWLLGRIIRLAVHRVLDSHVPAADPTAVRFLGQLARLLIYLLALLSYVYHIPVLHQLGSVWLTSVGVVSVIFGIAAQSTLGNLISGVSILLYRPFRIGDRLQITAPSGLETGTVESLSLGYTTLSTDDGRRIVIPNSVMASQTSINLSGLPHHNPAMISLALAPSVDIERARSILTEIAKAIPHTTDAPIFRILSITDIAVTVTITVTCNDPAAAAEAKSNLLEMAQKRLAAANIPLAH